MTRVLTIVGARPQFIKAAPVCGALREAGIEETLVHTGQHFDAMMSDIFFEELAIPRPAYNLEINSVGHGAMTGRMLERLEEVFLRERPTAALIYGDTNSTLAGALAASKLHVPIAHVEAGLRSFNRRMPEEINRIVADHLSSLLFCPTKAAVENLAREGVTRGVHAVGDVMYDATRSAVARARSQSNILTRLGLAPRHYSVATVHRAENTDDHDRFRFILAWLEGEAASKTIVLPAHPRLKKIMAERGLSPKGVRVVDPLGYLDMCWLTHNAATVFTDSGGLQKEAYFHRVPCVTLRDETEWVETLDAGWNRLWTEKEWSPRRDITDYGDGSSAAAIVRLMQSLI